MITIQDRLYWNSRAFGKVFIVTDKILLLGFDRIIPTFAIPTFIYLFLEKAKIIKPNELFRIPLKK